MPILKDVGIEFASEPRVSRSATSSTG